MSVLVMGDSITDSVRPQLEAAGCLVLAAGGWTADQGKDALVAQYMANPSAPAPSTCIVNFGTNEQAWVMAGYGNPLTFAHTYASLLYSLPGQVFVVEPTVDDVAAITRTFGGWTTIPWGSTHSPSDVTDGWGHLSAQGEQNYVDMLLGVVP